MKQLSILSCLAILVLFGSSEALAGSKTHVGVKSSEIVSLTTGTVPNDNSGGHGFFYDSTSGGPFVVPEKSSFVVTDIQILPGSFPSSGNYLVVIAFGNQQSRTFDAAFTGNSFYQSLTTGFVIPGGTTPIARNTTSSTDSVSVKIQGYVVKGSGLAERDPAF
jgi:hypothetical protein